MRLRRLLPALLLAAAIIPAAGCAGLQATPMSTVAGSTGTGSTDAGSADAGVSVIEPQLDGAAHESFIEGDAVANSLEHPADRSIVRSGAVSVQVDDPAQSADAVGEVVRELDGFIENEQISNADGSGSSSAYLQVRVPADRLDDALTMIGDVGTVLSQSRAADDVTAFHVDLQARVDALESSIVRLTELMAGSATTGELIEAETALSQRQQELDGLRAQLAVLEGQIEQASVSVTLTSVNAIPGGPDNFWEGLVAGWYSLLDTGAIALIVLGILLPWLVISGAVALIVVLIVRWSRRSKRERSGR